MGECIAHGHHGGWQCPVCSLETAQKESTAEQVRSQRESAETTADAIRQSTERQAESAREVAEATREAAELQAEAAEEAASQTEAAIERGISEQKRIARDSWKLEARSKIERVVKLIQAELFEEAVQLAQDAIKTDPGNPASYGALSGALRKTGDTAGADAALRKGLKLVRAEPDSGGGAFEVLLSWLPTPADPGLSEEFQAVLQSLVKSFPKEISWDILGEAASRGWHELAERCAGVVDVSNDIGKLIEAGSGGAAAIMAARLYGYRDQNVQSWCRGALWAVEVHRRTGKGDPKDAFKVLSGWDAEKMQGMILFLEKMSCPVGVSTETLADFRRGVSEAYARKHDAVLSLLRDAAEAEGALAASQAGFGSGCLLWVAIVSLEISLGIKGTALASLFLPIGGAVAAVVIGNQIMKYNAATQAWEKARSQWLAVVAAAGLAMPPDGGPSRPEQDSR